ENKIDTFSFMYSQRPDLINVDAEKVMLWAKTDNKTTDNYVFQYQHAPIYIDRKEALDYFAKKGMKELADGLNDRYAPLRQYSLQALSKSKLANDPAVVVTVEKIANTEKDKLTKAAALNFLSKTKDMKYVSLYKANLNDSSYSVAGAALKALADLEPDNAYALAKKYSTDAKGELGSAVSSIIMDLGTEADFDFIANRFNQMPLSQEKFESLDGFSTYLIKLDNFNNVKKGIDLVIKFRLAIPENFRGFTDPAIKSNLTKLGKAKGKEIEDYIEAGWK
ncbi:MAG: hypothetical protein ACOYLO_19210, partial [Ferruginibacter sp.]